ncbi:hypothetical protein GGR57DRAFT_356192 [Xylariaceae sp. FL1272]|nr:hypothetical protein GGR57DRAFT_356192 [Xylariaceae sp. FL1272]
MSRTRPKTTCCCCAVQVRSRCRWCCSFLRHLEARGGHGGRCCGGSAAAMRAGRSRACSTSFVADSRAQLCTVVYCRTVQPLANVDGLRLNLGVVRPWRRWGDCGQAWTDGGQRKLGNAIVRIQQLAGTEVINKISRSLGFADQQEPLTTMLGIFRPSIVSVIKFCFPLDRQPAELDSARSMEETAWKQPRRRQESARECWE